MKGLRNMLNMATLLNVISVAVIVLSIVYLTCVISGYKSIALGSVISLLVLLQAVFAKLEVLSLFKNKFTKV